MSKCPFISCYLRFVKVSPTLIKANKDQKTCTEISRVLNERLFKKKKKVGQSVLSLCIGTFLKGDVSTFSVVFAYKVTYVS